MENEKELKQSLEGTPEGLGENQNITSRASESDMGDVAGGRVHLWNGWGFAPKLGYKQAESYRGEVVCPRCHKGTLHDVTYLKDVGVDMCRCRVCGHCYSLDSNTGAVRRAAKEHHC